MQAQTAAQQYEVVAAAIRYLRAHRLEQPNLDTLGEVLGLSPFHLQRVFTTWAGISPKRFLQYLTQRHARELLAWHRSTLDTALESGLSGTGRLHALLVSSVAMTPGEVQAGGAGLTLGHGIGSTPYGLAQVVWTSRGLCDLAFVGELGPTPPEHSSTAPSPRLHNLWPHARWQLDAAAAQLWLDRVFNASPGPSTLPVLLRGTNFQLQVWQALLRTVPGEVLSYGDLAGRIGAPRAARAVGSAVAANLLAGVIPCHRVIREDGDWGDYRWDPVRKQALLVREMALGSAHLLHD